MNSNVSSQPAVDVDAYFDRIGYNGPTRPTLETLNEIVSAHVEHVPFENIDVLLDRPIGLDPASLQKKLVADRRGGYCFEQNGLLLLVLQSLGFAVTPLGGRVRYGRFDDCLPPRTHLIVRVDLDCADWIADVGFGGLSLTSAIRLEADIEQATPHETRRLVLLNGNYYHQARLNGEWENLYEFSLEPMPLIDREVANWYTSTHPTSHFRSRLYVARSASQGRRVTLLNDEFSIREADGQATKTQLASHEELMATLDEHFGLRFEPNVRITQAFL